ncbi:hypothetical protein F511_20129 [Dorcoceras hygrometricum]|uniref:Uncharacterized protein n=1 Tax=Dorcoceras hygrometricum TaxID=472368 RepID=A0A2Z7B2X4_9LAMI|nr:hypothetical protein F511_20129 [Dorcoceras hygrometricum]
MRVVTGPPKKATKKRKAPSSADTEVPRERRKKSVSTSGTLPEETQERSRARTPPTATPEEIPDPIPVTTTVEASSSMRRSGRPPPERRKKSVSTSGTLPEETQERSRARTPPTATPEEIPDPIPKEARATERNAMVAELEKANAWAWQEAERLKSEAREEFLKSSEFDSLLAKKAWGYFKDGFWGCLAQFRANGYPEEEHPASFLDLQQALADVGDEEEAEEEEEGEGGSDAKDNPPNSPQS